MAAGRRSRLLGVNTTSGRISSCSAWRRSRWKYCAGVEQLATRMLPSAPSATKRSMRALRGLAPSGVKVLEVARPERASPAEGYPAAHAAEQARIVKEALGA